jgi:hypothetical protein
VIGHDPADSRNQPFEHHIGPASVRTLVPKWVATTTGDVSGTPVVVDRAVYFGDFGGTLWKLDAETGTVVWSHPVPDYTGIAGDLARTSSIRRRVRSSGRSRPGAPSTRHRRSSTDRFYAFGLALPLLASQIARMGLDNGLTHDLTNRLNHLEQKLESSRDHLQRPGSLPPQGDRSGGQGESEADGCPGRDDRGRGELGGEPDRMRRGAHRSRHRRRRMSVGGSSQREARQANREEQRPVASQTRPRLF